MVGMLKKWKIKGVFVRVRGKYLLSGKFCKFKGSMKQISLCLREGMLETFTSNRGAFQGFKKVYGSKEKRSLYPTRKWLMTNLAFSLSQTWKIFFKNFEALKDGFIIKVSKKIMQYLYYCIILQVLEFCIIILYGGFNIL